MSAVEWDKNVVVFFINGMLCTVVKIKRFQQDETMLVNLTKPNDE
jgi:hypothetical protein